jgi:hypothetical protein
MIARRMLLEREMVVDQQRESKPEAELSDGRDRSVRTGDHLGPVVAVKAMPPRGSEPAAQPGPGAAIPGDRFRYDRGRVFLQLSVWAERSGMCQ